MRTVLFLPFFLFSCLPLNAQRIVVTNTTIDCGRVGYEQPVTATYELRNKGKRRLVIESVRTDCGCTAVDFPKEVPAGDNFTIKMTYDARQLGHFHKMAAIKSNGSKDIVYLTMKGIVIPEMVDYTGEYPIAMGDLLLDMNELFFDDVNKGDEPVQEIHIFNNGTIPMQPRMLHLPPYLSATTMEVLTQGMELYNNLVSLGYHSEFFDSFNISEFSSGVINSMSILVNRYFYPELAMYMAKPDEVCGTFMVRHKWFRMRVDDVQHNMSGVYTYAVNYDSMKKYQSLANTLDKNK